MKLEGKDLAYWERNQLVCYLTKHFPAWIEKHPLEDKDWENEWRNIVFIEFKEGVFSWHIHDSELKYFKNLQFKKGNSWKGETREQKYQLLNPT